MNLLSWTRRAAGVRAVDEVDKVVVGSGMELPGLPPFARWRSTSARSLLLKLDRMWTFA